MQFLTSKQILFFVLILIFNSCSDDDEGRTGLAEEWTMIGNSISNDLTDVEFLDNSFGIVSGSFGTLLKTNDYGRNWEELNVGVGHSFVKAFILNEEEFFTSRIGLYKTNDGGDTFVELGNFSSTTASIFGIHFFDSNNGLVLKSGKVSKTSNGGIVWDTTSSQSQFVNKMQFVTDSVGFIAGGRTRDGVSGGELHKTMDGGKNWRQLILTTSEIVSMHFLNNQIGYLSNFDKQLLKTVDGGENWTRISTTSEILLDLIFLDLKTGYSISPNAVLKTTDGGLSWQKEHEDQQAGFTAISKTANAKIIVVGNNGKMLRKN